MNQISSSFLRLFSLSLALLTFFARAAAAEVELSAVDSTTADSRRVALAIGINDYRGAKLRNPLNDADDMAEVLRKLGFVVTVAHNLESKEEMARVVDKWTRSIRPDGIALFYYSGHGAQYTGANYLVPAKARILRDSDLPVQALDLEHVLNGMNSPDDHINIVIVDACRSPLSKDISKGLAPVVGARGTYIAYATAPGSMASDGVGRNGLFTAHLLHHLPDRGIHIEEMLRRVRCDVIGDPDNDMAQMPWDASSLTTAFSFDPLVRLPDGRKNAGQSSAGGEKSRGEPDVKFTLVPFRDPQGCVDVDIAGTVAGADPTKHAIILFSWTDKYHIQPTEGKYLTEIGKDGTWNQKIHSGTRYAAILVNRDFKPQPRSLELPRRAGDVLKIAEVEGRFESQSQQQQ